MKRFFIYLVFLLRHKWHVGRAMLQLGLPVWMALWHDMTKFTPTEFGPYMRQFYNPDGSKRTGIRDATGAYDPAAQSVEFQRAWLNHQRNKHHWQAWVSLGDKGHLAPLPIPEKYVVEMVADWVGAGLTHSNKADPTGWSAANKKNMVLHPRTAQLLDKTLLRFARQEFERITNDRP